MTASTGYRPAGLAAAWLLLFGVMETSLALRLRSAHEPARSWYATPYGAT